MAKDLSLQQQRTIWRDSSIFTLFRLNRERTVVVDKCMLFEILLTKMALISLARVHACKTVFSISPGSNIRRYSMVHLNACLVNWVTNDNACNQRQMTNVRQSPACWQRLMTEWRSCRGQWAVRRGRETDVSLVTISLIGQQPSWFWASCRHNTDL